MGSSFSSLNKNILKKLDLYFDNLLRFELKQIFYIVVNRVIKPLFPFVGFRKNPEVIGYLSVKSNINELFDIKDKWNIYESSLIIRDKYYIKLKSLLLEKKPYYLLEEEDFGYSDSEILNNLCRFHLMTEITNQLELTDSEKITLIIEWIDHISASRNLIWNGFNTSMRLINWIKMLHSLNKEFQPTPERWQKLINSILIHLKIVRHNIENHVPGNHVLIQYFSVWLGYSLLAKINSSQQLLKWSNKKLNEEIGKEFYEDGLHFEYSFHYHIQATLFCLIWLRGKSTVGFRIKENVKRRLEKSVKLIDEFLFPDGTIPMLGDNCYTFLNSSLLEDINMCKEISNQLFKSRTNKISHEVKVTKSYIISQLNDSKLIFDIGNIGYRSNPGHGHSDLLSILYYDIEPLFIDPGTRTYGKSFDSLLQKKAISHNTLSIDNTDQALLWGFFRWSYLPKKLNYSFQLDNKIYLCGEYQRYGRNVWFKHQREIYFTEGKIKLIDTVTGSGTHEIAINFVLAPNIKLVNDKEVIILKGQKNTWRLSVKSDNIFKLVEIPFEIFPAYNVSVPSNKLNMRFSKVTLPFKSEIEIVRMA